MFLKESNGSIEFAPRSTLDNETHDGFIWFDTSDYRGTWNRDYAIMKQFAFHLFPDCDFCSRVASNYLFK